MSVKAPSVCFVFWKEYMPWYIYMYMNTYIYMHGFSAVYVQTMIHWGLFETIYNGIITLPIVHTPHDIGIISHAS